ncbi:hypothetical protein [Streptomyces sp. CB00455]|uniref:hypothetical protein n=1 Tax=Streptomyces sp. CB00455 TaxID=1703927 RepID=UPI000B2A03CE|nr:hypothetical protein [Streptomyces sp. CB00455]
MPLPPALLDYDAEAEAYDATRGLTPHDLAARLEILPGPDAPRAEPTYRVRSFVRR